MCYTSQLHASGLIQTGNFWWCCWHSTLPSPTCLCPQNIRMAGSLGDHSLLRLGSVLLMGSLNSGCYKACFPLRWTKHISMAAENLRLVLESVQWTQGRRKEVKASPPERGGRSCLPFPENSHLSHKKTGILSPTAKPTNESEVHFLLVIVSSKPDAQITLRWNMDLTWECRIESKEDKVWPEGPRKGVANVTLAFPHVNPTGQFCHCLVTHL